MMASPMSQLKHGHLKICKGLTFVLPLERAGQGLIVSLLDDQVGEEAILVEKGKGFRFKALHSDREN